MDWLDRKGSLCVGEEREVSVCCVKMWLDQCVLCEEREVSVCVGEEREVSVCAV